MIWLNLKKYINSYSKGKIIRRKHIMEKVATKRVLPWNHLNFYWLHGPTIDVYRRYLTVAGFLERVSQGKYKKIKHIPINISRRDVQRLGYDTDKYHKGW